MTIKHFRCAQTGVCQRLGAADCPDCDRCEAPLASQAGEPPRPTHPFAPGVIQGPNWAPGGFKEAASDFGLSARQVFVLVVVVFLLSLASGYLVGVSK